jgi:putative acetyltransferase
VEIVIDDLRGAEVAALLREHLAGMHENSPAESVHALDLDALRSSDITFFTAWDNNSLMGCGALKQHSGALGEVKSMRTATEHLRKGVAAAILTTILEAARARGITRVSLETGSGPAFHAAHRLYVRFGFTSCGPFADYSDDPFSRFFTIEL